MKPAVLKAGAFALALAAAGWLVAASGVVPTRASSGHWAITKSFLDFAMRRSIATYSLGVSVPKLDAPGLALKGAGHFETGCRSCHGAPGMPQSPIARAMLPRPPDLRERAAGRKPEELFTAVKHGLKFTGMPAWPVPDRDDEVWAVVAFLRELPGLDAAGYRRLVHGERAPSAPPQEVPSAAVQTCARCHGLDGLGRGSAVFPRLAGQRAEYQRNALEAYARGARRSGIMAPIASGLSPEAVGRLADYYSRLHPAAVAAPRDREAFARGRSIAQRGIRERRVPACVKCHGPTDEPVKAAYPALAGQPADYLELQLRLFKEGSRGGSAFAHLMAPTAAKLTPAEMRDVALYFEATAIISSSIP